MTTNTRRETVTGQKALQCGGNVYLFVKVKFVNLTEHPADAAVTATDQHAEGLKVLEQTQSTIHAAS